MSERGLRQGVCNGFLEYKGLMIWSIDRAIKIGYNALRSLVQSSRANFSHLKARSM